MPDGAILNHADGSKTVIEQDPSGDYHVYDQMPDGSTQERGQFGSGHSLDDVIEMYTRSDDADVDPGADPDLDSDDETDDGRSIDSEEAPDLGGDDGETESDGGEVESDGGGDGGGGGSDGGGDGGGDDGGGD